jgi:hypothetical protein
MSHRPAVLAPSGLARLLATLAISGLGLGESAAAATIHVHADGSGDAPTLAAGLAVAVQGDVVLASAGIYLEHDLQLKPGVALRSESGRDLTTLDIQLLGDGVIGADGATFQGFTLIHSGGLGHMAVRCIDTSPAILDNRFLNSTWFDVFLGRSTSEVAGNEFVLSPANAGFAMLDLNSSAAWIHDNVFLANDPGGNVSAIEVTDTAPGGPGPATRIVDNTIHGRVFLEVLPRPVRTEVARNVIVIQNGFSEALNIASDVHAWLHHNTIVGGGGVFMQGSGNDVLLDHNIVGFGNTGIEWASTGVIQLDCNDVYGAGQPYLGTPPGKTDFSADPLFCDGAHLDYHLAAGSPCTPPQSACGLVGALPSTGCGVTPARRTSWGSLKARYR